MKFVLATQNPKKLKEMSAILGELGVEVVSEADIGVKIEVEETGETFAENSLLKAKAVMEATKLPAIADDSGLCVDALNGGPGVYSARVGGGKSGDLAPRQGTAGIQGNAQELSCGTSIKRIRKYYGIKQQTARVSAQPFQ